MKKLLFSIAAPVLVALAVLTGPDLSPSSQARAAAAAAQAPFAQGPYRSRAEAESRASYWRSRGFNAIVWGSGVRWNVTVSRP
jgi:hypothetical protein